MPVYANAQTFDIVRRAFSNAYENARRTMSNVCALAYTGMGRF